MEVLLKITRGKIFFLRKNFFSKILLPLFCSAYCPIKLLFETLFCLLYFESYTRKSGSGNLTLRLVFTPLKGDRAQMKHTAVIVLSHSINPQSCVPIGESGFAVFPCQFGAVKLSAAAIRRRGESCLGNPTFTGRCVIVFTRRRTHI